MAGFPGVGGRCKSPMQMPIRIRGRQNRVPDGAQSKALESMEHQALNRHSTKTSVALRTVAVFETTKAAIVLLLGCGLFHLMHENLDEVAERFVRVLHVNSEGKLSNLLFELASHFSDRNLRL